MTLSTTRFSNRVSDYIKYRPHYPVEIIDLLAAECALTPDSVVADVGSGTGMLAKLFLENGNPVIGVEPNREMREGGEDYLASYARFQSVDGTSEATRLPASTVNIITAAQAFHWFDPVKTRAEFMRVLADEGWVVLVWNDRRTSSTAFLRDYEALLHEFGSDYKQLKHKDVQDKSVFSAFFGVEPREARFDNAQQFDFESLTGRLNSASYMPAREEPAHVAMLLRARAIFDAHQVAGMVGFEYDTRVFFAQMR